MSAVVSDAIRAGPLVAQVWEGERENIEGIASPKRHLALNLGHQYPVSNEDIIMGGEQKEEEKLALAAS